VRGSTAGATNLLVARQPILDRQAHVVAYELLARRTLRDATWRGGTEDSRTTSRVIRQAFLEMDVWSLTEGLPAYINFTRDLLLDGVAETLPPDLTVIEILETVEPDDVVAGACRRLRAAGYRIALDDVVADDPRMVLLGVVDIVKVDVAATTVDERIALIDRCRAAGVVTLAEKVETPEQHDEAERLGCDLFQGYFFQKPAIVGARQTQGTLLAHLQLLRSVTSDGIDRDAVGNILARDRYAARRFHDIVDVAEPAATRSRTVRETLDRLDDRRLTWAITLLVVLWLGARHPHALRDTALSRARFCEQLTVRVADTTDARPEDGYLVGLCSLLDAMVGEPLADVLERIQLPPPLAAACLHGTGALGEVLGLVRAYEHGRWPAVAHHADALGVPPQELGPLYLECLVWVRDLLRGVGASDAPR
jgi:EAL and modified HD-GYP domain-containing signal transduction protein